MTTNYPGVLDDFTLDWEGRVYEDVPGDPGGPTKWGITWKDANAYLQEHGRPPLSSPTAVRDLSEDDIRAIYKEHYWTPIDGDALPSRVDVVVFDAAVNVGTGRSSSWLQAVVGTTTDGQIGPKTLAAVSAYVSAHGATTLALALIARREGYYEGLAHSSPTLSKFLKGWLNRTAALKNYITTLP